MNELREPSRPACGEGPVNRIVNFESSVCVGRMLARIKHEQHETDISRRYFSRGGRRTWHLLFRFDSKNGLDVMI